MKRILIFVILLVMGLINRSYADYRVFELKAANENSGSERLITSTLDQYQYLGYHALNPGETLTLSDTWKCYGNYSHFRPHCKNPKNQQ